MRANIFRRLSIKSIHAKEEARSKKDNVEFKRFVNRSAAVLRCSSARGKSTIFERMPIVCVTAVNYVTARFLHAFLELEVFKGTPHGFRMVF